MNKNLSHVAVVLMSIILVVILYQTFVLKQYTTYNYLGIVAFIIFLAISVYDVRNADEEE